MPTEGATGVGRGSGTAASATASGGTATGGLADIEDVPLGLHHAAAQHRLSPAAIDSVRRALLLWYDAYRRRLPWRGDPPPYNEVPDARVGSKVRADPKGKKAKAKARNKAPGGRSGASGRLSRQTTISASVPVAVGVRSPPASGVGGGTSHTIATAGTGVAATAPSATAPPAAGAVKSEGQSLTATTQRVADARRREEQRRLATERSSGWRREVSAYGTWVSEIMCQQTRVATVIDYYQRWMKRFPTVADLAAASLEDVNAMWAGLGYYRRAKFLHNGAKYVVEKCGGKMPATAAQLVKVPGVGPYTAGAIASIRFGEAAPVVDGNVIRVLSRLRAIAGSAAHAPLTKLCWSLAKDLVDPSRPGDFNQAVMELGATVCSPKTPACDVCPIRDHCLARKEQSTGSLVIHDEPPTPPGAASGAAAPMCPHCDVSRPEARVPATDVTKYPFGKKKKAPKQAVVLAHVIIRRRRAQPGGTQSGGAAGVPQVLLVRRPKAGLLGGQWEFLCVNLGPLASHKVPRYEVRQQSVDLYATKRFGPAKPAEGASDVAAVPVSVSADACGSSAAPVAAPAGTPPSSSSGGDGDVVMVTDSDSSESDEEQHHVRRACGVVAHVFSHVIHQVYVEVSVVHDPWPASMPFAMPRPRRVVAASASSGSSGAGAGAGAGSSAGGAAGGRDAAASGEAGGASTGVVGSSIKWVPLDELETAGLTTWACKIITSAARLSRVKWLSGMLQPGEPLAFAAERAGVMKKIAKQGKGKGKAGKGKAKAGTAKRGRGMANEAEARSGAAEKRRRGGPTISSYFSSKS